MQWFRLATQLLVHWLVKNVLRHTSSQTSTFTHTVENSVVCLLRVVTETDTHAVRLSASSRQRQQATSDGVRLLQTPDLF